MKFSCFILVGIFFYTVRYTAKSWQLAFLEMYSLLEFKCIIYVNLQIFHTVNRDLWQAGNHFYFIINNHLFGFTWVQRKFTEFTPVVYNCKSLSGCIHKQDTCQTLEKKKCSPFFYPWMTPKFWRIVSDFSLL